MSQWGNEHPEVMAAIAALPPSQQNDALRAAIGYDPDAIREREEERLHDLSQPSGPPSDPKTPAGAGAKHPDVRVAPAGTSFIYSEVERRCDVCGAPPGKHHLSYCDLRGDV